jgi:ADP-heptose:LPS heptosyltransferase
VRRAALRLAGSPLAAVGSLLRQRGSPVGPAPRILLIRPDHLGDVLLATPAAAVLRGVLPQAQIDWLVGPWGAEVAGRAGGGDALLTVDFPGFTRRPKRTLIEPYLLLAQEAARLRQRRYDAALVLRPDHWWGAMLAAAAGVPRRFGYAVAECAPFLTDTLPVQTRPPRHAVSVNQQLARLAATRLSGRPPGSAVLDPCFPILPEEAAWARRWIIENLGVLPAEGSPDGTPRVPAAAPIVALHPGSGAPLKNWLPERWVELGQALMDERRARLFLTGGPGERDLVESIASRLNPRPPTIVGETSLGQLAALFSCADVVMGCDSGPLHLAATTGAMTVRLFGPTDPGEFGPWSPRGQDGKHGSVSAWVPCQPCRALSSPPCGAVERPACMRGISVGAVWSATSDLLAYGGPVMRDREAPVPAGADEAGC